MKTKGNFYDHENFYKNYRDLRKEKLNANELIEIPTIKSMLDNIDNKKIIDLGCGNGNMSKYFANNNAESILGVDISNNMLNEAKEINNDEKITYLKLPLEDINSINDRFDLAFSSLAFHYIEDFKKLIKDIHSLLNKDGILLFSQEHPLVTAPILNDIGKYIEKEGKRYYLISDYNDNSKRNIKWFDDNIIKYHRSFSLIINTLINQGFEILEVREAKVGKDVIKLVNKYKYQNDRPYFLFIKAKKK